MADDNNNIQIRIRTTAQQTASSLRGLASAFRASGDSASKASGSYSRWGSNIRKMNDHFGNINKDGNRATNSILGLGSSLFSLDGIIKGLSIYTLADSISKFTQSSINATETANLFNVALGKTAVATNDTLKNFSDLSGLNLTNLQNSTGTYALLARSMGLTSDQAQKLAINSTKLSIDLASLVNVSTVQAMEDIRSGLVGQTETMYKYGVDLTEASLKQEALNEGISKSVENMSQGEKMALRYATMIRQTGLAQGDFARTIDSPANQLKILSNRMQTLEQNLGNIFIPLLNAILPYLNAIVIILGEWATAIAELFGYDPSQNQINDNLGNLGDNIKGVGDNADDATKSLKDLKNETLGFDELNVVKNNKNDASILPNMNLPDYDNMLDKYKDYNKKIQDLVDKLRLPMEIAAIALLAKKLADLLNKVRGLTKGYKDKNKALDDQTSKTKSDAKATEELGESVVGTTAAVAGLAGVLGSLGSISLPDLSGLLNGIPNLDAVFGGIAEGLGELGQSIETAKGELESLGQSVEEGINFPITNPMPELVSIIDAVNSYLQSNPWQIPAIAFPVLSPMADVVGVLTTVGGTIASLVASLNGDLSTAGSAIEAEFTSIVTVAATSLSQLPSLVSESFSSLATTATASLTSLSSTAQTAFTSMVSSLSGSAAALEGAVVSSVATMASQAAAEFATLSSAASSTMQAMASSISNAVSSGLSIASAEVSNFASATASAFASVNSSAANAMQSLASSVSSSASSMASTAASSFSNMVSAAGSFASAAGSSLASEVSSAFSSMAGAIESNTGRMIATIALLVAAVVALGVALNSTGVGRLLNIGSGIAEGAASLASSGAFASGGFPTSGQLFVANESGAEMVGSMDGKTAVANNNQIVDGIRAGVYDAVVSAMATQSSTQQPLIVNLDGQEIYNNQQKIATSRGNDFGLGVFKR